MTDSDKIKQLEQQVAQLTQRITHQEDEQAVRKLQHLYGYLIDKCMYNEVVDLFADDGELHFFNGIWRGKESVRRLYVERFQTMFTHGNNGPIDGFLLEHPQHQDIVDIQEGGVTALGRFRCTMQAGIHKDFGEPRQWWEGGLYENTYVKENGTWKILIMNYNPQWHADFETGWAHTRPNYVPFMDAVYPEDPSGPDELREACLWPTHKVVPFHNTHPVTGKEMKPSRWQGDIDREKKG